MVDDTGGCGHGGPHLLGTDEQLRGIAGSLSEGPLAQEGHGAAPAGSSGKGVAVAPRAGNAAEQVTARLVGQPRLHSPVVEVHIVDQNTGRVANDLGPAQSLDDRLETHRLMGEPRQSPPFRRGLPRPHECPAELVAPFVAGGEMSKWRSAYRMMVEKTGAAAPPP